jgi:tRNA pseudouridine38-40 synthase
MSAPQTDRNILLFAQFEGTAFSGWQVQRDQRTVQGELAKALEKMVQHPVQLFGSSRTDAGVHALSLPFNFLTTATIPIHGFIRGLNSLLDDDLAVLEGRSVPLAWRARDAGLAKLYRYRFLLSPSRQPLHRRVAWHVRHRDLDLEAMRAATMHLMGRHDFQAFRSADCASHSTERWMHEIGIEHHQLSDGGADAVDFTVVGNAFLRNMVRILAGTLYDVGTGRRTPDDVLAILECKDRRKAGRTAPPQGLTLVKVFFDGYPRIGKAPLTPSPPVSEPCLESEKT